MKNYKYIISFGGSEIDTGEIEAEDIEEAREKIYEELEMSIDIVPAEED
jgi:hypothetical protein